MTLERISDSVYADTSGTNGGNFGTIVLDNEIVFVDSGMFHHITKTEFDRIKKENNLDVTKMILTHYHSDHILGAQGLGNVSIISSRETHDLHLDEVKRKDYLTNLRQRAEDGKDERPDFWKAVQTLSVRIPDIIFDEKISVGRNRELVVLKLDGHTAGSSIVEFDKEETVFIGDLVFNQSFPYAGDTSCDPDKWIAALKKISDKKYSVIVPGHGQICNNDVISEHIEFLSNLRDLIKNAIDEGISPDEFVEGGRMPEFHITERSKPRVQSTARTWFDFYKS